jgi:hypothetical protein
MQTTNAQFISSVSETHWEEDIDYSAPLYELMPPEALEKCRGKVVDQVSWATKPAFNGGKAVFRDSTPLALAFSWLEPYRARTNIAIVRFTDGSMLRIRRGRLLEMEKDDSIFRYFPSAPAGKPKHPVCDCHSTPVEYLVRPFPRTRWIQEGKILAGPDLGSDLSDYEEKQKLLVYFGVTRVLSLIPDEADAKAEESRLDETLAGMRKLARNLDWDIDYSCAPIRWRDLMDRIDSSGKVLDAVFNARTDYGLLYVCAEESLTDYIELLCGRYYGFPNHNYSCEHEKAAERASANITLLEAMRSPPKGYPAKM